MKKILENVKKTRPLIHNITNYVTVNDVANAIIAVGASPIMADDPEDAEEITAICNGLNINIGTLNDMTIEAMKLAGEKSKELGHVIVLDPVGAGASSKRTETAKQILYDLKVDVLRGNVSEIKALAVGTSTTKGVDANLADKVTKENLKESVKFVRELAENTGAIVAMTGEIDIVSDDKETYAIYNGDSFMGKITGTGCILAGILTAFVCANKENKLKAAVASICFLGVCGERAKKRMDKTDGNLSFRTYLIDAIYNLTPEELEKEARYERI